MKTVSVEIDQPLELAPEIMPLTAAERLRAFLELTKPRITFLVVLTSVAGFVLGSRGPVSYQLLASLIVGVWLLSSGIAALNQYFERALDALMNRTRSRPLPSRRLSPVSALAFGMSLTLVAEIFLALYVNPLTAGLGVLVVVGYLVLYTPLKTRTSLSTVVGAIPGAMPPLLGWTAVNNRISIGAIALFAIMFLWQFPHFLAIAWMYREDYERAGILMLPVVEPDGRITARQIMLYSLLLLPTSLVPTLIGLSGRVYFFGAIMLGLLLIFFAAKTAVTMTKPSARRLLLASVLYLPLLFVLMVLSQ